MNLKKDIRVGIGVGMTAMALLSPLLWGVAGEEAAAAGGLSRVVREGEGLARATTPTESLAARPAEEVLAKQTASAGLKRTREDLEGGGSGGGGGLAVRTRDQVLRERTPLSLADRTELVRTMPGELKKLHDELRKIAPGHFEHIPLRYMTEKDLEEYHILYDINPTRKVYGGFRPSQQTILLNKSLIESSSFDMRTVVYHESAHLIEGNLGTRTPGLMHNDAFQQIHSTVWARAYGHDIITREELDAYVASMNTHTQLTLDKFKRFQAMKPTEAAAPRYANFITDRTNHFLNVAGIMEKAAAPDDDVLLKARLREWPFPERGGGGGGGGGL